MKTAKEWAEYLPQAIKHCFIIEATNQKYHFLGKYPDLYTALDCVINFEESELGFDFWQGVYYLAKDYKGREAEILTDLEWIDELEVAEDKAELAALMANTPEKVIKTLQIENQALTQSNLKLIEELNSVHKENTELKARCEALSIKKYHLEIVRLQMLEEFTALQVKTMEYQDQVIMNEQEKKSELDAGKVKLTFWQGLKQLFGCN